MANWWTLKILSGKSEGKTFKLKPDRTIVGRVKGDVVLDHDEEASSVHAEIHYDVAKGVMVIEDLKSRNGVHINGKRVKKRVLAAGDRVKIGITEMVLEPPTLEETVLRSYASDGSNEVSPVKKSGKLSVLPGEPAAKEAVKAKPQPAETSPAPVEANYEQLPTPREYNSHLAKFFGVLFRPVDFFDWMGDDSELAPALKFGAFNWITGGLISGVLSYFFTYVWNLTPPGPDYGNSPAAIALNTLFGFACLPVVAVLYHSLCVGIGGRASFQRAVQVTCFVSAVHFVTALLGVAPKVGPFLVIAGSVYSICVMTLAAVRIYHISVTSAYASGAALSAFTIAILAHQQMDAKKIGAELTRQNNETAKVVKVIDASAPAPAEVARPVGDTAEAAAIPLPTPEAAPSDAANTASATPAPAPETTTESAPSEPQQQRIPATAPIPSAVTAPPDATPPEIAPSSAAPAAAPNAAAAPAADDDPAPPSFYGKPSE